MRPSIAVVISGGDEDERDLVSRKDGCGCSNRLILHCECEVEVSMDDSQDRDLCDRSLFGRDL